MKIESRATYTCMRTLTESVLKTIMFAPRSGAKVPAVDAEVTEYRPGLSKLNSLLVRSFAHNLTKVNMREFQQYVSRFKRFIDSLSEEMRREFRAHPDACGIEIDLLAAPYRLVGNWIHNNMTVGHISIAHTATKRMPCIAFSDRRTYPESVCVNPNGVEYDANLLTDACYQYVFMMNDEDRRLWYKLYHSEDGNAVASRLLTEFIQLLNEGLNRGYILWESAVLNAFYENHESEAIDTILNAMISHPIYGGVEDAFTHSF